MKQYLDLMRHVRDHGTRKEDRTGTGSAPNLSLTDNLIMKSYRAEPIGHGWTIDGSIARQRLC